MKYSEAKKILEKIGFSLIRNGNGSHMIFQKNKDRIVLSFGNELSPGMAGKIRQALNRHKKTNQLVRIFKGIPMRRLIETIKRLFYWGYKLRNSHDWDSCFLEEIILLKLIRMRECFNSETFHHNRWSLKEELANNKQIEFKQGLVEQYKADVALDICIALLKRRNDDVYDKLSGLEEHIKDMDFKFEDGRISTLVKGKPATADFILKKKELYNRKFEMMQRDKKLLFNLLEKYLESWWS